MANSDREAIARVLDDIIQSLSGVMKQMAPDAALEQEARTLWVARAGVSRVADKLAQAKATAPTQAT